MWSKRHAKLKHFDHYTEAEIVDMVKHYNMTPEDETITTSDRLVDSYDDLIDNLFFVEKGKGRSKKTPYRIQTVNSLHAQYARNPVLLKAPEWFKDPIDKTS